MKIKKKGVTRWRVLLWTTGEIVADCKGKGYETREAAARAFSLFQLKPPK